MLVFPDCETAETALNTPVPEGGNGSAQPAGSSSPTGGLYSLQDLDKLFSGAASVEDVGPGHALAGNLVNFMVDRYSFAKVKQVVANLGKGQTVDEALTYGIGTGSKGLESAWHQWLLAMGQPPLTTAFQLPSLSEEPWENP